MLRAIRVRVGACVTAVTRVILGCLCNLYIETRLPKYLIVVYLGCVVNFCITLQDSQSLHPSPRKRKILTHCSL